MNAFYEHHRDSIRFGYRCFDRILLNGLIQPFQQPERVVGFFATYRHLYPVSRDVLRGAAEQFQCWVKEKADKWNAPIVEAPKGRRDEFVDPYFKGAKPDQVVVILKAREPARIMTAIGDKKLNRWHLQIADRWIVQYNLYVNDQRWGRIFVLMSPYLPFSARVCLNQHHWLANRMREQGVDFQQCSNAFLRCARPERLQELADTLTAEDLSTCGQKWLTRFTPFFTERERQQAGCRHRLFFSQIEFCDNLIFRRRAALDKLGERLLDANRTIGQPNKITVIFGRKVTKQYRGKLQTEIEDMNLPNPVIRSHYRNGFIKQYVRDHLILRTEAASNNVTDYGVNKAVEHLPACATSLLRSITITWTSSRISSRRLSIAVSSNGLPSPPSPRPANAFRASSSTILDNWLSCTLSCALRRSRPPTPSAPAKSILTSSPPSVAPLSSIAWPPFDTTSPSFARKASSKSCPAPAATVCRSRDIRSA